MRTSRTHHCSFAWWSNKVTGLVFLLSVSRCGISRRQAYVRGRGDKMGSRHLKLWISYSACISGHNRRDASLTALKWQLWKETIAHAHTELDTNIRLHCLFNLMLTSNICPTHPTHMTLKKTLWAVLISISTALRSVVSRATTLDYDMSDLWLKERCDVNS